MKDNPPAPFDTLLGYAPGHVPVYSSHYPSVDETAFPDRKAFRNYVDGVFMGYKWQCVEFARRWLFLNHGLLFDNVPMAYDIFHLRTLRAHRSHELLPLRSFRNGSPRRPEPGCMLIWEEGGEFEDTGHVAIVTEVFPDRIRIAEQNRDHQVWPSGRQFSRELQAREGTDGRYWIETNVEPSEVRGWVIQTDQDEHAETFAEIDPGLLSFQPREAAAPPEGGLKCPHPIRPEDEAFHAFMGGYRLTRSEEYARRYFLMSESAHKEIRYASNEVHSMFMQATQLVIEDEGLLRKFGFPPALWPRIRQSWENRRNQLITGRLDFSVSERGIKIYEYNADSASCYMECGRVQKIWAEQHGCEEGSCPGEHLQEMLVHAWKKCGIHDVMHIMRDEDLEETYHARYMRSAMEEAGIRCNMIPGVKELAWNDAGEPVDKDGEVIRWVWKTWAWETALDQLRAECSEDEQPQLPGAASQRLQAAPRLVDVLMRRQVRVFEPMWTLVPSNKAILPVLWEMWPDHPFLLETQFSLTPALREQGYVTKPIVGRSGSNISIVDSGDELVQETAGQFDNRDLIYQQFFGLPKIQDLYLQVSSFIVDGRYAGACTRVDTLPIITGGSDVLALRVVPDAELLGPGG